MDRLPDKNWSEIAGQAFEKCVLKHDSNIGVNTMEEAMARLRASKRKYEIENAEEGLKQGEIWATKFADYEELLRLRSFFNDCNSNVDLFTKENLVYFVSNKGSYDLDIFEDTDPDDSIEFLENFCVGAINVLDKFEALEASEAKA